jgi:isoleucyl-tRNA synthetase
MCWLKPEAKITAKKSSSPLVLAEKVLGEQHTILATYKGSDLVGARYTRLFDGVPGPGDQPDLNQAYRVIGDDFVSLDDGTGIVHIAPAYGDLDVASTAYRPSFRLI